MAVMISPSEAATKTATQLRSDISPSDWHDRANWKELLGHHERGQPQDSSVGYRVVLCNLDALQYTLVVERIASNLTIHYS